MPAPKYVKKTVTEYFTGREGRDEAERVLQEIREEYRDTAGCLHLITYGKFTRTILMKEVYKFRIKEYNYSSAQPDVRAGLSPSGMHGTKRK